MKMIFESSSLNSILLIILLVSIETSSSLFTPASTYYKYTIDPLVLQHPPSQTSSTTPSSNWNPYSQPRRYHHEKEDDIASLFSGTNETFVLRKKVRKSARQHLKSSKHPSEQREEPWIPLDSSITLKPELKSTGKPPDKKQKNPHHVLVGYGKTPLDNDDFNENEPNTTTTTNAADNSSFVILEARGSNLQPMSLMGPDFRHNYFIRRQPLVEVQQQEPIEFQQHQLPYYQCDAIIQDYRFIVESPNFPAPYPDNKACTFYIGKNRSDVCQIEITIVDMELEDTAQCSGDYFDIGANTAQQERLCGLMLRNTKRTIYFPANATHIRMKFHSNEKNDRPYKGFSAEVQQIPNSCQYVNGSSSVVYPPPVSTGGSFTPGQYPIGSMGPGRYPHPPPPLGPGQQYPGGPVIPSRPGQQYPSGSIIPLQPGQQYPNGSFGYGQPMGPHYQPDVITPARGYQYPITPPNVGGGQQYPYGGGQQPYPVGGQYPINENGGINTGYGQRLYPPTHPFNPPRAGSVGPAYVPGKGQTGPGVIYSSEPYPPRPGSYGGGPSIPNYDPNRPNYYNFNNNSLSQNNTPIYLASYCDVYLGEFNGEIRSPGYPFGYPVNHSCIYTIKKASEDVCQLELVFHHFDIQTPNTKKDMTDNCQGDYLQTPDGVRWCGYFTQSMSGDYKLKKYFVFPESSEYVFMHFVSDGLQTPDGSGFWIEVKQMRNSCSTNFDYKNARCDKVISGRYSTVERIYSPNYPQYYGPHQQCVYFVQPADDKTCEFELELLKFNLEQPTKQDGEECRKDFLQLPDRTRICGHHTFRRIFQFPKYHDRTAMFYFHSDDQIQDQGYEIIVRQIPNSCSNYNGSNGTGPSYQLPPVGTIGYPNYPSPGNQQGPWNTNVYVPANDPNLPGVYVSPTPVFTYDNSTGSLQPYQPPLRPPGNYGYPGGSNYYPFQQPNGQYPYGSGGKHPTFGRKNVGTGQPVYWSQDLPSVLNDPRNVDSSGTIPLYFANGTLATRIPPMKPVDMIPFLKKGKTIVQKGSTGRLFTTRSGNSGFETEDEPLQSSRLMKEPNHPERMIRLDPMATDASTFPNNNLPGSLPTYNCDDHIRNYVQYIRSPNFPSNYPVVSRCIYTITKADNSVCQIRLHLLTLDLEYTSGCKNDYLQIEPTGEKLCGRINQPEVRVINYYGYSREIRLIFNSDRQTTGSGFEVRIEQVPNSCDDLRPNATLNSVISGNQASRSFRPDLISPTRPPGDTTPYERMQLDTSTNTISQAQALTNSNQTTTMPMLSSTQPSNRICRTTSVMESHFESEHFPLEYPSNIDCLYKVFRANRDVCRLEIEFDEFNVGDENQFGTDQKAEPNSRQIGDCLNDFLEIDSVRYCGQRIGQKIAINFPKILNEISFRFFSANGISVSKRFNGFRIKVKQIDENCRTSLDRIETDGREIEGEFSPAIIESCPKFDQSSNSSNSLFGSPFNPGFIESSMNNIDASSVISEEVVKIQSPQFGLPSSSFKYSPFLDCHYVIQKANRNVCSLEIRFEIFALEESPACSKDFLEINHRLRLCGKLPMDTIKVFDFVGERMLIHFHTDSDMNEQGFAMILRQIRC